MTYLHTDPHDPTAPMWMFHLPSFTLAQLVLNGAPNGDHLILFEEGKPPDDDALLAIADILDQMAPNASSHLTAVAPKENSEWKNLPEFMRFTPALPHGPDITVSPVHGYARFSDSRNEGRQFWKNNEPAPLEKAYRIRSAAREFDEAFEASQLAARSLT